MPYQDGMSWWTIKLKSGYGITMPIDRGHVDSLLLVVQKYCKLSTRSIKLLGTY